MLDYEWGSVAAALRSTSSSVTIAVADDPSTTQHITGECSQIFNIYDDNLHLPGYHVIQTQSPPPPVSATALAEYTGYSRNLSFQPAGVETMGLNLNLGVRTYFPLSSSEPELVRLATVYRRPNSGVNVVRCQAEGCEADLTCTKQYYRRHKVCELHSKAPAVVAQGLYQRFCQQCSRFHLLSEFDQTKRSCRKRLADHNRRRRKSQPPDPRPPPLPPINSNSPTVPNFTAKPSSEGSSCGSQQLASPAPPSWMTLGSCFRQRPGGAAGLLVPGSKASSCTPTSSSSSRSFSNSLLRQVPDLRPSDRRVSDSSWYDHEKAHYQQ